MSILISKSTCTDRANREERIWLIDLAKEYPHVQCDGFDISSEQYPASGWLPSNITLSILDIHKPVPKHLRGQYDVVHVGLLVLVVAKDDPTPIVENLMALLSMRIELFLDIFGTT